MQHILLFTFVLTIIIFFTMFWGSTEQKNVETELDVSVPKNDSNTAEVVSQQRKSDLDSMPNSSGTTEPSSAYSVLGVN